MGDILGSSAVRASLAAAQGHGKRQLEEGVSADQGGPEALEAAQVADVPEPGHPGTSPNGIAGV